MSHHYLASLVCTVLSTLHGVALANDPTIDTSSSSSESSDEHPVAAASEPARVAADAVAPLDPLPPADSLLLPLVATNLPEGDLRAFSVLFAQAYQANRTVRVVRVDQAQVSRLGTPAAAVASTGATEYFEGYLVGLDTKVVISMTRFDADGRPRSVRRMTAKGIDDFDEVATRLAVAFAEEIGVDEARDLDTVTESEGEAQKRVKRERLAAVRGGVVVPIAALRIAPMATAAIDVRHESRRSFVGFGFGVVVPSQDDESTATYGGLGAEVTGGYYLTRHDTGVYLGGGLQARILNTGANVAPYVLLGALFDRTASAHLFADVRLAWSVTPIRFERAATDPFQTGTRVDEARPLEPSLNAGVAW